MSNLDPNQIDYLKSLIKDNITSGKGLSAIQSVVKDNNLTNIDKSTLNDITNKIESVGVIDNIENKVKKELFHTDQSNRGNKSDNKGVSLNIVNSKRCLKLKITNAKALLE